MDEICDYLYRILLVDLILLIDNMFFIEKLLWVLDINGRIVVIYKLMDKFFICLSYFVV